MDFENKRAHVIGIAGQEGRAVFEYLLELGVKDLHGHENAPKKDFEERFLTYSDAYTSQEAKAQVERFLASSAKLHFQDDYLKDIKDGDLVIVPQSYRRYSQNQLLLEKAQKQEIVLKQAIQLVFEIAPCPIIGVTGSVGKSTVTAAIAHILKKAGKKVYFSGNDREDKWDLVSLSKMPKDAFAVLEISNRHLIDLRSSPPVGVLNNIYPHHLDDHGSFKEYIRVKKKIFSYQKKGDFAIVDYELIKQGILDEDEVKGKLLTFSLNDETDGFVKNNALYLIKEKKEIKVIPVSLLPSSGEHNQKNFLAASLACLAVGISPEKIKEGLLSFKGLRYRQEALGEFAGRKIYDDGKSTDPIATIVAVRGIPKIDLLLLGGVREGYKKGDFAALAGEIAAKKITKIIAYGRSGSEIREELKEKVNSRKIFQVSNLEKAIELAFKISKKGDVIVFSPACQSFDEFRDYRQRAERFEELISSWKN